MRQLSPDSGPQLLGKHPGGVNHPLHFWGSLLMIEWNPMLPAKSLRREASSRVKEPWNAQVGREGMGMASPVILTLLMSTSHMPGNGWALDIHLVLTPNPWSISCYYLHFSRGRKWSLTEYKGTHPGWASLSQIKVCLTAKAELSRANLKRKLDRTAETDAVRSLPAHMRRQC